MKKLGLPKSGLFLLLKLRGGKKGPNILGLGHQTTGSSLVCIAVWMTDKAQ